MDLFVGQHQWSSVFLRFGSSLGSPFGILWFVAWNQPLTAGLVCVEYHLYRLWLGPPPCFLRYKSKHIPEISWNCWWTIVKLYVHWLDMVNWCQIKFNTEAICATTPAPELLQHRPWRLKTNGWLPMLKTRSSVQEAGDGHPGPWCSDFWGATCCFLESGTAGWSWVKITERARNSVSKTYDRQCQPQWKKQEKKCW